jgi:hypothetical protein
LTIVLSRSTVYDLPRIQMTDEENRTTRPSKINNVHCLVARFSC